MDWRVAQQSHIEGNDDNEVHPHPPQGRPTPQPHHQNTYIVQFPREQVYYVPPPEHAEFIQRQRNNISSPNNHPSKSSNTSTCCPRPNFIIVLIFFCLVAIVAIAIFVLYFLYKPTFPSFSVSSMSLVTTHNNNHSHPLYKITLTAINPNAGSSFLYHNDAHVSLLSGKALVGKGQFLVFQQQPDSSSSVNVEVKGVDDKTMEINEDDKKSIAFVLEMRNIRVNTLLGAFNFWTMQCNVDCDFKVNSLTKQTRVLSQQCTTNS